MPAREARALVEEKDLENEKLRAQRHKLQPLPNALDLLDGSARPGTLSRSSSHSSTATATAAPGSHGQRMQLTYGPTVAAKGFPTSGAAADGGCAQSRRVR